MEAGETGLTLIVKHGDHPDFTSETIPVTVSAGN
jgi:hypothetical protein